jgi:hypothetical protein
MLNFRGLALALAVLGAALLGLGSTSGAEASYHGYHHQHAKRMYHAKPAHHHRYVKVAYHAKPKHHLRHHVKVAYHHPKPKYHYVRMAHPKPSYHHHHANAAPKPAHRAYAGKCGTYKYYKGGQCLDARDKKSA